MYIHTCIPTYVHTCMHACIHQQIIIRNSPCIIQHPSSIFITNENVTGIIATGDSITITSTSETLGSTHVVEAIDVDSVVGESKLFITPDIAINTATVSGELTITVNSAYTASKTQLPGRASAEAAATVVSAVVGQIMITVETPSTLSVES